MLCEWGKGTSMSRIRLMENAVMNVRGITWSNGRERETGQIYKRGGMTSLVNEFVLNHIHSRFNLNGL